MGNINDDLLDFDIPTWAVTSLVNSDDSGLEDDDIEKLNKFTDEIVAKYGNANFMMGSDEEMESQFKYKNDIDGVLGADVVTMYLQPTKNYAKGTTIKGLPTKQQVFNYWNNQINKDPKKVGGYWDSTMLDINSTLMSENAIQHFGVYTEKGETEIEEDIYDWGSEFHYDWEQKNKKYAKGTTIKFDKLPKNRQANKNYDYFAVGKIDGKIVDGFEIVDDVESLKYYAKIDLKDNDYNPKNFNIVSAKYLIRKGINPFDYNNWRKIDYSTNESAYATKFLEGEIYANGGGIKNLYKIKISIGDTVYNHIDSLNKEQLEKQLSELKQEIQRELDNSGKSQQYFKYKDEEFFILYRLERGSEFKYAKGGGVDMYSKFDINKNGTLSAKINDKNYEVIYRDDISGMYDLFENDKKIKSSKVIRDLMQFPKKYKNGGAVESEINELYKKSKFINDDFNWKLKLMEMIQDRSIEAYNIYQSLTKEQKEEVLQEQFEVDNDMGSDGDGTIKTTKQNIRILLNDAKNGTKYEEFSLGGKIDNGYFNNCFLKSIFGV